MASLAQKTSISRLAADSIAEGCQAGHHFAQMRVKSGTFAELIVPGIGEIPVQFIIALPYILTVLLLAGFVGEAIAPKAVGVPYSKEKA